MNIILFMIPLALLLGFGFLMAFLWAASQGQFDDLETPALRILIEDKINKNKERTDSLESKRK